MKLKTLGLMSLLFISSSVQGATDFSKFTVVDGDTIKVEWNIPYPMLQHVYFRIIGMDAPELFHPKCEKERLLALKAKDELKKLLNSNFTYELISWDKYGGRILIKAYYNYVDISSIFIDKGLAVPYTGEKNKFDWCLE